LSNFSSANQRQSGIMLERVNVAFGSYRAVQEANLVIDPGEFFTLLGPSGCGKTTLLRTIAGFNRQTSGSITLGDIVVNDIPAHKRDAGMVFQNYAIFPHLNVEKNVAFGLKEAGVPAGEISQRVAETLRMVDLAGYETRMPRQLSGGQQQRVVIARTIIKRPRVLLMDEPLANLDAKLRIRLRRDLKQLQQKLGLTTIYVTHDQEEALSLSDRIAVMSGGKILQVGHPEDIYERPTSLSVAEFIGEGTFLRGEFDKNGTVRLGNGTIMQLEMQEGNTQNIMPGAVWIGFRPHDAVIATEGAPNILSGRVCEAIYLGSQIRLELDCGLNRLVAAQFDSRALPARHILGQQLSISVSPGRIMLFAGAQEEKEL